MRLLTIKNFKCFKNKEIQFANLTVLAGENGAGKSTVIQSLLLFAQSFNRKDYRFMPKKLYVNDYYCELGSSERLLHYEADSENIEFTFKDKNDYEVNFITKCDKNDSNILNISNHDEVYQCLHNNNNNALSFIAFFDFIGADRLGPRAFHHTDSNFSRIRVGKLGEYTALVLDKYKFKRLQDKSELIISVNHWLSEIFGYIQIDTQYIEEANVAMLKVKNRLTGDYESPMNMPYGVSYLLPIIVSCLVRHISKEELFEDYTNDTEENEMVVVENPEAHLHPKAQSKLGYFLTKMSKYIQIVIETHSEHIINGIRIATLDDDTNNNDISINFFEVDKNKLEPNVINININEVSDLSDWPKGFFDQQAIDVGKIFKSRAMKNVSN